MEELANAISHGIGAVAAAIGTVVLVGTSWRTGDALCTAACLIYGLSLCLVFLSSTLYHSARNPRWRSSMLAFDYIAIYLLIAGSYTPFAVVPLREHTGWWLLGGIWTMAAMGIGLRLWLPSQWTWLSTAAYVAMGWGGALGAWPLVDLMPPEAIGWLIAGGITYTVGAGFFLWELLPFNHLWWHVAVLVGAACHYVSVFGYVVSS